MDEDAQPIDDEDDMVMAYRDEDHTIQIVWYHNSDTVEQLALSDDQAKVLFETLRERLANPDVLGI